jgi:hypothetical protein
MTQEDARKERGKVLEREGEKMHEKTGRSGKHKKHKNRKEARKAKPSPQNKADKTL